MLRAAGWACGKGRVPHQGNLRRGQSVGLVDEVAESARQVQGFGGQGAGGDDGAGVLVPQRVEVSGGLVSIVNLLRSKWQASFNEGKA